MKNNNKDFPEEMPLGLGMALAQDMNAMHAFMALSDEARHQIMDRAHSVNSKAEMRRMVSELSRRNKTE